MKKIINGLRYDTDNAIEVGSYDNGLPSNDFQSWGATLYKTPRSGRFFLAGSGGPMTMFARHIGDNTTTGSSRLTPMTEEEAFEWAQQYLDADEIEKHFKDSIEDA